MLRRQERALFLRFFLALFQALFDEFSDSLGTGIDTIAETEIVDLFEKVLINDKEDLRLFAWHGFT
jgi:hypothetical protein